MIHKCWQVVEKSIDIEEDKEEPGLVVVRINSKMGREQIVEEILRRLDNKDEKPKSNKCAII